MGIFNMIFAGLMSRFEGLISTSMFSVVQQLIAKSRKALLIAVSCFVFAILLSAGIIISVLEASAQLDTRGVVYFSALLTSGTILSLVSLFSLTFILWPRSKSLISAAAFQPAQPPPHRGSPLEDTLALLLNEVVNYVKEKNKPDSDSEKPNNTNKASADHTGDNYSASAASAAANYARSHARESQPHAHL